MTVTSETTQIPARLDFDAFAADFARALAHLDRAAAKEPDKAGIDPRLRELIGIRASQLNGCAYCIDMHTTDARTIGETEGNLIMTTARRCGRRPSAAARPQGGVLAHTGLAARRVSAHPAQARRWR